MHKHTNFLLKVCLSSLVFTASIVAINSANVSANEAQSPITKTAQLYACAGKNPCGGKKPCAGKNPCAGKPKSVGGPLAKEIQGKPVVVDIYANWCSGCKKIAPTLSQLKEQYSGQVNFVVFDVTDKSKTNASKAKAEKLGLEKFFKKYKSKTSTVAIIDPDTGRILEIFAKNPNKADYTKVLDTALAGQ
ncbi:MAG: redoxin domain-containing protein [Sphaerospermopsis sp. SIO1G2]|nr:redoxin domain-containing protein [Sphaerospermopsis sp. SIO1G1]NET71601.1 redoxin domain-containing protein [Sphaerospermopsis sp. SIO1G2]